MCFKIKLVEDVVSQFLHDLNNPLTIVKGEIELTEADNFKALDKQFIRIEGVLADLEPLLNLTFLAKNPNISVLNLIALEFQKQGFSVLEYGSNFLIFASFETLSPNRSFASLAEFAESLNLKEQRAIMIIDLISLILGFSLMVKVNTGKVKISLG
jgi:hypothetical protein